MKVYTKTGDDGSTSLFGGNRISKSDLRIEAYGQIDELNASIGILIDGLEFKEIKTELITIQNILFNIGSNLATIDDKYLKLIPTIEYSQVKHLENRIDDMESKLPKMTNFVLPSGHRDVSNCHMARTICRRAERRVVSLGDDKNKIIIKFINRLSDYLFVMSRHLCSLNSVVEVVWDKQNDFKNI